MNAIKRWTFGGLLLVLASATGCVAQVGQGQGNEDPGSAPQQLTAQQPAATAAAQPRADIRELHVLQTPEGTLVVGPREGAQQLRVDPSVDPGAPLQDDGDGREPDPHPWHGDNVTVAR